MLYTLLLLGHRSLLGDVDSIKELTQILVADVGLSLNLSGSEGNQGNIVSTELNLILNIVRTDILHALEKLNLTHPLLSKEVTNLNNVAGKSDIDGKVRVYEAHLINESTGNTDEHVIDV